MENADIEHTGKTGGVDVTGDKELTKKRITVWFVETQCEALLLSVLCVILSWPDGPKQDGFFHSVVAGFMIVSTLFFSTGYMLTTAIVATFWRARRMWLYPTIAAAVFSFHLEMFFFVLPDTVEAEKLTVRIAGPCIVFACTLVGSYFLRDWAPAGGKLADAPNGV
jgi:hypothetical protein